MAEFIGIDVSSRGLHCAAIDERRCIIDFWLVDADEVESLAGRLRNSDTVALDAPLQLSTEPHGEDGELSPKFRSARCAEIALLMEHGVSVPWVAPTKDPPPWISVGLRTADAVRAAGTYLIEVYPHAGFWALNGEKRPAKKRTSAGIEERADLLRTAGISTDRLEAWSHDSLDALVAALIAHESQEGTARVITCGCDGSAIWLPARV